jgi:hypothetical protein
MKARFRLLEKWFKDEGCWRVWGAVYENCVPEVYDQTLLFRTIPDDDRRTARFFSARVRQLSPSIEDAECLIDRSYPIHFRILPTIHTVEGENHREIRARLWEILFDEMEKQRLERQAGYVIPEPAYYAVHERANETGDDD